MCVRLLELDEPFLPLIAHSPKTLMKASQADERIRIPRKIRLNPAVFLVGVTITKGKQKRQHFVQNKYIHNHKTKAFGQALILLKRLGNHRLEMLLQKAVLRCIKRSVTRKK